MATPHTKLEPGSSLSLSHCLQRGARELWAEAAPASLWADFLGPCHSRQGQCAVAKATVHCGEGQGGTERGDCRELGANSSLMRKTRRSCHLGARLKPRKREKQSFAFRFLSSPFPPLPLMSLIPSLSTAFVLFDPGTFL